jgi:hypothetical protein
VLSCTSWDAREPLPGLHERYIAARWRQVLGSTMHCVAGDGIGILAGAVVASFLTLTRPAEIGLEYVLGFAFGWTIFQGLFMRGMAGGSYRRALATTFLPEFLSMNLVMTGMVLVATAGRMAVGGAFSPLTPEFWFVMSMSLLSGFLTAYPMNWWLVANGLKHGMMTVRKPSDGSDARAGLPGMNHPMPDAPAAPAASAADRAGREKVSRSRIAWMLVLSVALFAVAFAVQAEIKAVLG